MGRLYIYVDFDGFHVGKYNGPMDCLGKESKAKNNINESKIGMKTSNLGTAAHDQLQCHGISKGLVRRLQPPREWRRFAPGIFSGNIY